MECVEQAQYYMSKAATQTGLKVVVNILNKVYEKGRKVAEGFQKTMKIVFDNLLPKWVQSLSCARWRDFASAFEDSWL